MSSSNWYKILLTINCLLVLTTNTTANSAKKISKKKPHIIVMVADDLGWADSSWNNPHVKMPHLNNLATTGVILNQSYVQPTCTPTRAALMTGRYPFTMGLQSGVIKPTNPRGVPLRAKMLPRLLKNVGYKTHAIGKWHLGFCSWDYTPTKRGFDTFYGFYCGAQDYYTHKRGTNTKPRFSWKTFKRGGRKKYLDLRNNTKVDDTKKRIYSTDLFATAAEEIIRLNDRKDPMFMYVAFQSVHSPLQVPEKYSKRYKHIKSKDRRIYLGMVTAMDEAVGRIVKALKKTQQYENSIIIFTSDNGGTIKFGGSNWPLRGGKATLWEGGMRAPAFIHSPHLPNPGTVTNQLFHVTDWFSTIAALAGSDTPNVDGINQWDALAGKVSPSNRLKMIYNIDDTANFKAGVRFKDYKMILGTIAMTSWASPQISTDGPQKARSHFTKENTKLLRSSRDNVDFQTETDHTKSTETIEEEEEEDIFSVDNTGHFMEHINITGSHNFTQEIVNGMESNHNTAIFKGSVSPKNDDITWGDFKKSINFNWDPKVLRVLEKYMLTKTIIRLYNIQEDPEERNNLSSSKPHRLYVMLNYLARQLRRYVAPRRTLTKARGHPIYWKNVWSPGWCDSKW